jgi:thiol-disulfide isomerase/thioredoxin
METEPGATELTVYSRPYCHLCDDMIAGLHELQARFRFRLTIVDVDSDEALDERYGADVPVLVHGSRELCRHRLAIARVTDYLAEIG